MAVRLPKVILGEETRGGDLVDLCEGLATIPCLDRTEVAAVLDQDRGTLIDVPLQEILSFVYRTGKLWRSTEFPRRRLYVRYLQSLAGCSEAEAEAEADLLAVSLSSYPILYDLLDNELGDAQALDGWVRREEVWVRAMPLGLVVHLLPGNVPQATVLSLLRGILTKNVSFAKVSSSDPITALSIAQSFADVDPTHPVTRSLSVGYWDPNSDDALDVIGAADGVCAWGAQDAIDWATRHASPSAVVSLFRPKRSVCLVGADADIARAARDIGHDVCHYDQRGCFSTHQVFVERAVLDDFVVDLCVAMESYETILPVPRRLGDDLAWASIRRMEEQYVGADVRVGANRDWAVIVGDGATAVAHPLCRTVFVDAVDRLADAVSDVDASVQTVAVTPWDRGLALRDALARRGVSRIVDAGAANFFRPGGAHDGRYPLQDLVRWVGHEAPKSYLGKSLVVPLDQTQILEKGRYTELLL